MKNAYSVAVALVALYVGAAGIAKLFGVQAVAQSFATMALPDGTAMLVGLCEVAAALAFYIGPLRRLAAACLIPLMLGALYYHLAYTPALQAAPALLILLVCAWVLSRPEPAHG
ncbi:DoxX family protein [Ectopseudomonas guguanensis]|uniref:DoxX-like family protein n=1 Tax=Ectopseudomonas guguanensis TaxID=1198456 RepID=A0A1H0XIR1_9GAMM|nr:DoxX family protein [Pseudomonas guguanensis]SDQ02496.1 DoxX-like family protein [Pseudomonas guguanensis]